MEEGEGLTVSRPPPHLASPCYGASPGFVFGCVLKGANAPASVRTRSLFVTRVNRVTDILEVSERGEVCQPPPVFNQPTRASSGSAGVVASAARGYSLPYLLNIASMPAKSLTLAQSFAVTPLAARFTISRQNRAHRDRVW